MSCSFGTYIKSLQITFLFFNWHLICMLHRLVRRVSENVIRLMIKKLQHCGTQQASISLNTVYYPVCETVCSGRLKLWKELTLHMTSFSQTSQRPVQRENPTLSSNHKMKENQTKTEYKNNTSKPNNKPPQVQISA